MEPWFLWLFGNSLEIAIGLGVLLGCGLALAVRRWRKSK